MANEYLKRTPTSTGNRKVHTASFWAKINAIDSSYRTFFSCGAPSPAARTEYGLDTNDYFNMGINDDGSQWHSHIASAKGRDCGNWMHFCISVDSTRSDGKERIKYWINGKFIETTVANELNINADTPINHTVNQFIGKYIDDSQYCKSELSDFFLVDGQALTPEVFGFYKDGNGYISAGSTQATDFRNGQWVPRTPREIKNLINDNGGFGVNGFYLPMNDSSNFGADFHTTPNSIITLKGENLAQPRNGAPDTTDAYVSQLRSDPYAANLVLALPFVSGGLQSGFGDYAPSIKGSGSAKTMSSGSVSIASTASYYGTSANYQNANSYVDTPGTSGDFNMGTGDFTVEGWFYPIANGGNARLFGQNTNTYNAWDVYIDGSSSSGQLWMMGGAYQLTSASIQGNQWNHVAISRKNLVWNTYINGVAAGIVTSIVNNTVGDSTNKFRVGQIGENAYGGVGYGFQGYIQDFRVYKGVAKYKGGFDVPKPYTPVGIGTWRAVPDTTANNFATLNGTSIPSKYTLTEGNLRFTNSTNNWTGWLEGTVGFSTGKYYWETRIDVNSDYYHIGIVGVGITHFHTVDSYKYGMSYQPDGRFFAQNNSGPAFASGKTHANDGDIVQVAVDMNDKKMWIGVNGNWIDSGDPIAGTGENFDSTRGFDYQHYVPFYDSYGSSGLSINFGQNPTFGGKRAAGTNTDDNGRGLFSYDVPTGFLALCEDNLPTPTIKDPGEHFKTVLYSGSSSERSITGLGFKPDLVWIKDRDRGTSTYYHALYDSIRGSNRLSSNLTSAEADDSLNGLKSFDDDGFSIGVRDQINGSSNFVAWCWKAGGPAVTNTDGSITSQVSVNQDAGFSIVSYTGNGVNLATVGHGLNKAPSFIISKNRIDSASWPVYHKSCSNLGNSATDVVYLDLTTVGSFDNYRNVNDTTFGLTNWNGINGTGDGHIAYCWTEIEGYSKMGTYRGAGNRSSNTFVYCGFKPAWVMVKNIEPGSGDKAWAIYDSSRDPDNVCVADLSANHEYVEGHKSYLAMDFVSNGFKIRSWANWLSLENQYIFVAFAESPFQTANAK